MKLDCNLYLAYISFNSSNWVSAKEHFNEAYFAARQCNEVKMAEQCLCNAGIASGNLLIETPTSAQMQQTFYKTGMNFGGASMQMMMQQYESESESEDSYGEASYL